MRSFACLRRQRERVRRLVSLGANAETARLVLGSMEQSFRVLSELWEMRLETLDAAAMRRSDELLYPARPTAIRPSAMKRILAGVSDDP
jgi:hypothetical protein